MENAFVYRSIAVLISSCIGRGLTWEIARQVVCFAAFLLLVILASSGVCIAEEPFVIAFDRFGQHDEIDKATSGALLVSELNCVACHDSDDPWLQPKGGPRLEGAGNRIQSEWIREFLQSPHAAKPGTTMPDVLSQLPSGQRDEAIESLVAFLSSRQKEFTQPKAGGALPVIHQFWNHGDTQRGKQLFHTIGCVACHQPSRDFDTAEATPSAIDELIEQLDADELEDLGLASAARRVQSIPLPDLSAKYSYQSLTTFLLWPHEIRPNARMPSLRLSPAESADIAAYLVGLGDPSKTPQEIRSRTFADDLIAKGAKLFAELNCQRCHQTTDLPDQSAGRPFRELDFEADTGCLNNTSGRSPRYGLTQIQKDAITTFAIAEEGPLADPENQIRHRMLQLNCFGCHERGSIGGVGRYRKPYFETFHHVDLGDEGRLPPTLQKVENKLNSNVLAKVFDSKTSSHRPFMKARMPAYSAEAVKPILSGLSKLASASDTTHLELGDDSKKAIDVGRELVNTGCVQCHAFGGESLPGVVGIDLQQIDQRIRPDWFYEFVKNPNAVKERTRMPTFFPNGESNRKDLLDGDVDRQLAAIWAYLGKLPGSGLPRSIDEIRSANFELVPNENPIVLRTFMDDAGTHAIAVGFRQELNFAFDAERLRLALMWKGRFLDAKGTWYERFTPPANPLGTERIVFPLNAGRLLPDERAQFRGYRLDEHGVPTFLYRIGDLDFTDKISPSSEKSLRRTVTMTQLKSSANRLQLHLHSGKELRLDARNPLSCTDELGLSVRLLSPDLTTEIRQVDLMKVWLLKAATGNKQKIELEYQW
ncbi:cytochrome c [Stieleria sp. JC731]|uniref:c-type cytochrome n=1 Tax=Pirellulaceae TaxID=2691357 RepID=UPI001E5064E1|nr:c-type cytochrome [Stieleria sp. JC731]MCC9603303.1 cytochrome c [Stieleria sp. JC731]